MASLNGVEELQSRSSFGRTRITLTYNVKQDMDKALVLLLSKLSAVNDLPDDAQTPRLRTSNSDDSSIARLALVAQNENDVNLAPLASFLDTHLVDPVRRIAAVAAVGFHGGRRV